MKTALLLLLFSIGQFVTPAFAKDPLLPSQERALGTLALAGFTEAAAQIPATVIDSGILSYLPYASFRVGPDRELNVYGDASAPACIEIGLYRGLLNSDDEKRRCIAYMRQIFPSFDPRSLRLSGGKILSGGTVIEITPPDSADAYGGWWISVYSLPLIRAAAGTSASVSIVSVAKTDAVKSGEWSEADVKLARTSTPVGASSSRKQERIYDKDVTVKAYKKADGTTVKAHTRSK